MCLSVCACGAARAAVRTPFGIVCRRHTRVPVAGVDGGVFAAEQTRVQSQQFDDVALLACVACDKQDAATAGLLRSHPDAVRNRWLLWR